MGSVARQKQKLSTGSPAPRQQAATMRNRTLSVHLIPALLEPTGRSPEDCRGSWVRKLAHPCLCSCNFPTLSSDNRCQWKSDVSLQPYTLLSTYTAKHASLYNHTDAGKGSFHWSWRQQMFSHTSESCNCPWNLQSRITSLLKGWKVLCTDHWERDSFALLPFTLTQENPTPSK